MHPIDLDNFFKKEVASDVKIDSLKFRLEMFITIMNIKFN